MELLLVDGARALRTPSSPSSSSFGRSAISIISIGISRHQPQNALPKLQEAPLTKDGLLEVSIVLRLGVKKWQLLLHDRRVVVGPACELPAASRGDWMDGIQPPAEKFCRRKLPRYVCLSWPCVAVAKRRADAVSSCQHRRRCSTFFGRCPPQPPPLTTAFVLVVSCHYQDLPCMFFDGEGDIFGTCNHEQLSSFHPSSSYTQRNDVFSHQPGLCFLPLCSSAASIRVIPSSDVWADAEVLLKVVSCRHHDDDGDNDRSDDKG